jgi:predicted lipoprotein with Yx(FWY)xxD motif
MGAGAALVLAACGSSSSKAATSPPATVPATAPSSTAAPTGAASSPGVTIKAASVPGVGTVLVNGSGQTLYLLTSEKGGKITCTDANGCTKIWPDTELPAGTMAATAGSGIQSSLLGTVKDSSGRLFVTYGSYPLYTFAGDKAPGSDHGQGITNFGGTWWVISPAGTPITMSASHSSTTPTTASSSGAGWG